MKQAKTGVLFQAIPEINGYHCAPQKLGPPTIVTPNYTILTNVMKQELVESSKTLWFPGMADVPFRNVGWLVNMCADGDEYFNSLSSIAAGLEGKKVPVFNHPKHVLDTRRDVISSKLQGIKGLTVPKCVRFSPALPADFRQAFEENEFEYPVLVRPVASQTGRDLILIENAEDWDKIFAIPWGGKQLYMTQFVDFSHGENDWIKIRLSVTSDNIRIRHTILGNSWLLHGFERTGDIVDREMTYTLHLDKFPDLMRVGEEIRKRVPLDYFGIDLGFKSEEEFVLFEANPAMSILSGGNTPKYRRQDYLKVIRTIEQDVWDQLIKVTGLPLSRAKGKIPSMPQ